MIWPRTVKASKTAVSAPQALLTTCPIESPKSHINAHTGMGVNVCHCLA